MCSKTYVAPGERLTRPMNENQIRAACDAEEERRRREAKARKEEIIRLTQEQADDQEGRLWGETGFDDIAARWHIEDDSREEFVLGMLSPYRVNAETILLAKEWLEQALEAVRKLGGKAEEFFTNCLDADSFNEIASTTRLPKPELFKKLWQILVAVIGEEFAGSLAEFIAKASGLQGPILQLDRDGNRVRLSDEARQMPLDDLYTAVLAAGYNVSRPTVWRAKQSGWFSPGYHHDEQGRNAPIIRKNTVGIVRLTSEERELSGNELGRRFGISSVSGGAAKKRGWFEVNKQNQSSVRVTEGRLERVTSPRSE